MPAIYHKANSEWHAERLVTAHAVLSFSPARIIAFEATNARFSGDTIELMRADHGREWLAIIPDDTRIVHNGQQVTAGLRVLAHGDLLAAPHGGPVFFSTEDIACIEPFSGVDAVPCARCKGEIAPGAHTVRCPNCGVVHHESPDRRCWTYSAKCSLCSQTTALDIGLQWSPEAL